MAHLDLANLRTTLLGDTQLAAVALHRTFAGHLPVSSGHLVVCDPLVQAEAPALADYTAPWAGIRSKSSCTAAARRWPWSGSSPAKPSLRLPCTGRWHAGPRRT